MTLVLHPNPETAELVKLLRAAPKGGIVKRSDIHAILKIRIRPGQPEPTVFWSRLNAARAKIKDAVYEFIREGDNKGDLMCLTADVVATKVATESRKRVNRSATRGLKKLKTVDPLREKLSTEELQSLSANGFILKTVKRVTETVTYQEVSKAFDHSVNNTEEAANATLARIARLSARDVDRDRKRRGLK